MLAVGAVGVAGAMTLLGVRAQDQLAQVERENAALEADLAPLAGLPDATSLQGTIAEVERRQGVVDSLRQRGEGIALVTAASGAVRTGAWLTALDWDGSTVRIEGLTFDPSSAADVMQGLQSTGCFSDVELLSVDSAQGGAPLRFALVATDDPAECGATSGMWGRPFTPPHDPSMSPDINRPPLLRWDVTLYRVTDVTPGREATVRDPDGRSHTLAVDSMLGRPAAKVTFITDSAVILSQDTMVDASQDRVQSTILELPLDP